MKAEPIIAVKDVELSSKWYQALLACKSIHGGAEFDILSGENQEVLLCLHKWGEHQHPSMTDQSVASGNGLIIYFRTNDIQAVYDRAIANKFEIERELQPNVNSHKNEFSLRDPDGYYLTISEYHTYQG